VNDNIETTSASDALSEIVEIHNALNEHAIVAVTDRAGNITYVNNKFIEISGYSQDELIGANHRVVNSGRHDATFFDQMWKTISSGNVWKGEIQNKTKCGKLYWVETLITPVLNKYGKVIKYISTRTDVTERKLLEAEFRQLKKEEAIGRITANIAHNFNNSLGIVIGSFEMLDRNGITNDETKKLIKSGLLGANRTAMIVRQFTKQLHAESYEADFHPFHKTVSDLVETLSTTMLSSTHLKTRFEGDLSDVYFDKQELEECIKHLVQNSEDSFDAHGLIELRTQNITLDEQLDWSNLALNPGQYVLLEITDNGPGISPDIIDEIFDPFFTTVEFGLKKGLGLNNVRNFVNQHNGHVGVLSDPEGLTVFRLYLPVDRIKNLSKDHTFFTDLT